MGQGPWRRQSKREYIGNSMHAMTLDLFPGDKRITGIRERKRCRENTWFQFHEFAPDCKSSEFDKICIS